MAEITPCLLYCGEWFGLWGRCRYLVVYGIGWLLESGGLEYFCIHLDRQETDCPTRGRRK